MRLFGAALLIAVVGGCDAPGVEVRTADGSDVDRPLANASAAEQAPAGFIVYVADHPDGRQVRVIPAAGGAPRTIAASAGGDVYPAHVTDDGMVLLTARDDASGHLESLSLFPGGDVLSSGVLRNVSRRGDTIVAESNRFGFRDLLQVDVAQNTVVRLTTEGTGCFDPALSPDGRNLAFVSSQSGDPELYRMPRDDAEPSDAAPWQRLTWSRGDDAEPTWSPNGRHIAFLSSRRGVPAVYLMDDNGSRPHALTPDDDQVLAYHDLRWSPDGQHLAFVSRRAGRATLMVVRPEDGRLTELHRGEFVDQTPTWSPDGQHIAFASNRDGDTELYRLRVDLADPREAIAVRLTLQGGANWLPHWVAVLPPGAESS